MSNAEKEGGGKGKCKIDFTAVHDFRSEIPLIVEKIVALHNKEGRFSHLGLEPVPSRITVIDIIVRALRIIFPGYFTQTSLDEVNVPYYFGQHIVELFDILSNQLTSALRHDCMRFDLDCAMCAESGKRAALNFLNDIPRLQAMLAKDVEAAYEGDPASKYFDEIIFSYPGLFAVAVYRMAHQLYEQGIPLIPRIMTEYAHGQTGIDIHPAVHIGESFFMDHGTGVVIGETTTIGDRVRIYQGVTLGALSLSKEEVEHLRSRKRHPTIEDDVIIYANATILGGDTVIGARSVIGGNVWLTESVPPDTSVFLKRPELIVKTRE